MQMSNNFSARQNSKFALKQKKVSIDSINFGAFPSHFSEHFLIKFFLESFWSVAVFSLRFFSHQNVCLQMQSVKKENHLFI